MRPSFVQPERVWRPLLLRDRAVTFPPPAAAAATAAGGGGGAGGGAGGSAAGGAGGAAGGSGEGGGGGGGASSVPPPAPMQHTRLYDMTLRAANVPTGIFCHRACCEHLVFIRDVRRCVRACGCWG